ncbi:MAG: response regulator, partial [Halanaerobiales bacterium]
MKKSVLVVDDAKNILMVLEMSLKKAGYQVYTARDGLAGLQLAQKEQPDLILLDILLPKMNGFLVYEALQEEAETEDIPVVFLSARAEKEDLDKALSMGAADYLVKPINQNQLLSSVGNYINGGK